MRTINPADIKVGMTIHDRARGKDGSVTDRPAHPGIEVRDVRAGSQPGKTVVNGKYLYDNVVTVFVAGDN